MVHTYSLNGYNIALDVESGAVHVLSGTAYEILRRLGDAAPATLPRAIADELAAHGADELRSAYAQLMELKESGMLFAQDDHAAVPYDPPVKAMCLHVAHDCNIRCGYCFASTGDFAMGRGLMPEDVGRAAVDYLMEKSMGRRNLEVDFFGGEPLMNMKTVRAVVEYARRREAECGKRFRFTLTTNAVLLDDDTAAWMCENMDNVVLSLDGRREVNDRMRRDVGGRGTYDAILPKLLRFAEMRGDRDYYVRGTFTRHNLDFADDAIHLLDLGFPNVSIEPVVAPDSAPYAIRESDLGAVFAEYERLALALLDRRGRGESAGFFHFNIDLSQGPCVIKRMRGCGAGCEYVAVTPSGDIYPCHQFVGVDGFLMGELGGKLDRDIRAQFLAADITRKEDCRGCWAKYYCSGGCNANNYLYAGAVSRPYKTACEMEKKRIECALMMKAAQSAE